MYKIQLQLISFSNNILLNYLNNLIKAQLKFNNFTLKKISNVTTLLKSPHVHKKSRIQYKSIFYKKIITLNFSNFLNFIFLLKLLHQLNTKNIYFKILIFQN